MTDATRARYEAIRHLGRGASAEVYLIRDLETGEERVLKRIALASERRWPKERAEQELAVLRRLKHPNVVELLGVGLHRGFLEVHYPYHPGESLKQRLGARAPLSVPEYLPILRDVLTGLAYLHSQGLVHRDLKPENVYLTQDGRAILLDLGLVKDLGASEDLTATGEFVGTPMFCSPETFIQGTATPAMDLYSTAVMSFLVLTGAPPYGYPRNLVDAVEQHLSRPFPTLASAGIQAPGVLEDLVAQMATKSPEDRPGAAVALGVVERLLSRADAPVGVEARSERTEAWGTAVEPSEVAAAPAAPPLRSPRRAAGHLAGLVGLALVVGMVASHHWSRPPPGVAPPRAETPAEVPSLEPAVVREVRELVDAWTGPDRPDPVVDFDGLRRAPALEALRRYWSEVPLASRLALAGKLEEIAREGRAVGLPPVLAPFQWPVSDEGPARPARLLAAVGVYGGQVPEDLQLPGAAAAARAVDEALAQMQTVEARLLAEPRAFVGSGGRLMLLTAVVRTELRGGLWFVLSFAADPEARRGLYSLYEPVIQAAVRALRHLVLVAAQAPDGAPQVLAEAWLRQELAALCAPLLLTLYFVPVDDLLVGLSRGRREVAAATLHGMAARIFQAASLSSEAEAAAQAVRAARAASDRAPAPPSVARVRAALHFEGMLGALHRQESAAPLVQFLERSTASWDQLDPQALQDILVASMVTLKPRVGQLPRPLRERIFEVVAAKGRPASPSNREVAVELLRAEL